MLSGATRRKIAAAISRDLEGKGMELVDVFSQPEDGMYAYLARKGDSDLYLAFRGTMCLPSVKVDLDLSLIHI